MILAAAAIRTGVPWILIAAVFLLGMAEIKRSWNAAGLPAAYEEPVAYSNPAVLADRTRNFRVTLLLKGAMAFLFLIAGFIVVGNPFHFPERFIPTKWSDFQFWSEAFRGLFEQLVYLRTMKFYETDILFRNTLIRIAAGGVLATFLVLLSAIIIYPYWKKSVLKERGDRIGFRYIEKYSERIRQLCKSSQ